MGFKEFTEEGQVSESEMKYQALSMAKEIHSILATTTFIEMLSVMSADNPAKKEVQALETELNDLTTKVGEFIQKYIPDVADAEAGDDSEIEDDEDEDKKPVKKVKKVDEAMVGDWTKLTNKSGNVIYIKSNTNSAKRHTFDVYIDKNGAPIEKNKLNKTQIKDRHDAGEFDTFFPETKVKRNNKNESHISFADFVKENSK